MSRVQICELPDDALLRKYLHGGAYADCYTIEIAGSGTHTKYVEAFYTTSVFKLERLILAAFAGKPSTDVQAAELAKGTISSFAAWNVEAREPNQLLLTDFRGRTRSWLMSTPTANSSGTKLYFGSAVVPLVNTQSARPKMGAMFRVLLGFHKIYSRVLLRAAAARLLRSGSLTR